MWSRQGVREDEFGNLVWSDAYHIIDAANKAEARAATGLPRRNDVSPDSSSHKAKSIYIATKDSPTQWLALIEYAIPPSGGFPDPVDDPLLRPWRWRCDPTYEERANEMDAKRRLKKNSAGVIFPPRPARYRRRILVGTRYERFWDIGKSRKFENKTNSANITLGPVLILPYEALCHAIEPAAEFEGTADYLLMQYIIEVAVDERATPPATPGADPISGYPFEHHQRDISNFGWYTGSSGKKLGRFCYATGTTAASSGNYVISDVDDVQLDGQGKPVARTGEDTIYVRNDKNLIYEPTTNPHSTEWLVDNPATNPNLKPTESPYSTSDNRSWLFIDHVAVDWENMFAEPA